MLPDDFFDLVICNPPFHQSSSEAKEQSSRKNRNLNVKNQLNFKGVDTELWCRGGEVGLIKKMIQESALYQSQLQWVTSLVSSKENLPVLYEELKKVKASSVKTFEMSQIIYLIQSINLEGRDFKRFNSTLHKF